MTPSGAAALIIGNEVLTAKVNDQNGPYLIRRLREQGIGLHRVYAVPDEIDAIVEALLSARRAARWVFTSGGIGPTHDDVTVRAVALALGCSVVRMPEMEVLVRAHYGEKLTPEALRLAEAPAGSHLWFQNGLRYPVLVCNDVFMLPGVPELFKLQLEVVLERLPKGSLSTAVLYLSLIEAEIAAAIDQVALSLPQVAIGSYPTFDPTADYRVKITVEHVDGKAVAEAVTRIVKSLPSGALVRRE
ncbi:MAG: competence/damage-inducible protein A [Myxococcaceae bacterium]|nr:competence/damage-inducible protein A [Myxococcaceae bacterium]